MFFFLIYSISLYFSCTAIILSNLLEFIKAQIKNHSHNSDVRAKLNSLKLAKYQKRYSLSDYLLNYPCSDILQAEELMSICPLMLSMHDSPGSIYKVLLLVTGTVRILVKLLIY